VILPAGVCTLVPILFWEKETNNMDGCLAPSLFRKIILTSEKV
jgi:hypothetical protein